MLTRVVAMSRAPQPAAMPTSDQSVSSRSSRSDATTSCNRNAPADCARSRAFGSKLKPIARDLGCSKQLARVEWLLDEGTGSHRQVRVFNANHDIVEVAEEIADAAERV